MQKINKTQQAVFEYIKDVIDKRGVAPSVREIGSAVGLKSTSTVQYNLDALEKAGYIQRDPQLKRTIRITNRSAGQTSVPLLGTVTAGQPILASQSIEDYISVPLNKNDRQLFALRVKGESMMGAGILDGDVVIVDKTPTANNGDIIVALIDDEATVKRFFKENGVFRLQPENDSFKPIIVNELLVLGKVIMVIRSYE